jgi:hypothetical protein
LRKKEKELLLADIQEEIDRVKKALDLLQTRQLLNGYRKEFDRLITFYLGAKQGLEYAKYRTRTIVFENNSEEENK